MKRRTWITICLNILLLVTFGLQSVQARSESLGISPRLQETPVWCWVTVLQMVFEHYDEPNVNPVGNYQCGIIGVLAGPYDICFRDCSRCIRGARSISEIKWAISAYPTRVKQLFPQAEVKYLDGRTRYSPLSSETIKEEIDAGRPVITGISFSGSPRISSEHVALIVGYDEDEDGNLILEVNDPFPYDAPALGILENPYVKAGGEDNYDGSFNIKYNDFRTNFYWRETIYEIE
jgi:hypothetical protein